MCDERDVVLHHLVLREQFPVRRARHRAFTQDVERALRLPEPPHRVVDTTAAETLLREQEPLAGLPDQVIGGHPAVGEHDLGVVADASVLDLGMRHRADVAHDLHPGCARGHDEHRRVAVRPALGVRLGEDEDDVGDRRVGDEPLVAVDDPLVAVPGRRRADHSRVGAGEERLGERERARDLAPEVGPEPALLLRVGRAVREQLHVPAVGSLHAEDRHRHHAAPDDLRHQGELQLAEPVPAELRIEERTPQSPGLHLRLEVALDRLPLLGGELVEDRFERYELAVDERPHPGELLFELGLGLEIPRHTVPDRRLVAPGIAPSIGGFDRGRNHDVITP